MTTKTFDLGTVLTITTGKLLTDIDNVYEILSFMTGDNLFTHQLPRAMEACEGPLLEQFPELTGVMPPKEFDGPDLEHSVKNFVATVARVVGKTFEVTPLESWQSKNPLTELAEMTDKPIVVVTK